MSREKNGEKCSSAPVSGAEQGPMNRRNTCFSALMVFGALTTSCSSDSKTSSTTAAPVTTGAVATTAASATASTAAGGELPSAASVEIKQFKFGPGEIHVAVGGTVTWTNSDNQKHTATASGGFDTAAIEGAATGTATFATAGTFAYMCSFHPFMKGTVVVGS